MISPIFAFVMTLILAFVATPWVRRLAIQLKVMVPPGGRRVHTRPMPLWGGIAIYGAFAVTALLMLKIGGYSEWSTSIRGVLVAGALILTMGLLDDLKEFRAVVQFGLILLAGVVLMTFGIRIHFLTNPFGGDMIALGTFVSVMLTLLWIFGVTKTVDLMDGLDGLAAGIGAIAAGILAIMAHYADQPHVALMAACLSGACVGFLRFNFNPAKIFMGTGGSQFIGFTLAAISIIGAFKVTAAIAIALPVLVFGVPIFDGLFVVIKRFRDRRPIHIADQSHLHHRLMDRGLTHKQAVLMIYFICFVLGAVALTIFLLSR